MSNLDEGFKVVGQKGLQDGLNPREKLRLGQLVSTILANVISSKSDYDKTFNKMKTFYIIESILGFLATDALTPDVITGQVVDLYSEDKLINAELDAFQEEFDVDQIVNDVIIDLLGQGEYILRNKVEKGKGITKIVDDVDQKSVIALYDKGLPDKYIVKKGNKVEIVEAYNYTHFVLGRFKIRVNLNQYFGEKELESAPLKDFPRYVRVGRPVFYGVLDKIKELMLMESLIPAEKLNQLTTNNLVEMKLPATMEIKEGFNAARKMEDLLNKRVTVDRDLGTINVADLLAQAGKMKVMPSFGDKGGLNSLDVNKPQAANDVLGSVKDLRELITNSIGFPSELIFGGDANRSSLLKRYARYLRKLKDIQTSIAGALKQMALIHLSNKGKDVDINSIKVKFRNEIVNIDELEKLEYMDAILSISSNYSNFVTGFLEKEGMAQYIDIPALLAVVKDRLGLMGDYGDAINVKKKKSNTAADTEQEDIKEG